MNRQTIPMTEFITPDDPGCRDRINGGNDESQRGIGNPRITIDFGKSAHSLALCAAFCGICAAVTVVTVYHSSAREVETQARLRVMQNHIDENTALLRVSQQLEEKYHASIK